MTTNVIPIIILSGVVLLLMVSLIGLPIFMHINRNRETIIPPTRLSHVVCPYCSLEFDYAWIPGVSFTDVRMFKKRIFYCPGCKKCLEYNVFDSRVDPKTHHCKTRIGPS
ncbi:MAG TPA: hypothetical protein VEH58_02000 [Dehalococcoidales bacterium]|nr:hypothetical protein [Dehalococcoidales bacterium]